MEREWCFGLLFKLQQALLNMGYEDGKEHVAYTEMMDHEASQSIVSLTYAQGSEMATRTYTRELCSWVVGQLLLEDEDIRSLVGEVFHDYEDWSLRFLGGEGKNLVISTDPKAALMSTPSKQPPRSEVAPLVILASNVFTQVMAPAIPEDLDSLFDRDFMDNGSGECLYTHTSNYTCQMSGNSLPITFLPLSCAFLCSDGVPKYGVCHDKKIDHLYEDEWIRVFVSHKWHTPEEPISDSDWDALKEFLAWLIRDTIRAVIVLLGANFPMETFLGRITPQVGPMWSGAVPMATEDAFTDGSSQVRASLMVHLLALVGKYVAARWDEFTAIKSPEGKTEVIQDWFRSTAEHMLLWFDFCSIPQSPRTESQTLLFKNSLNALQEIQIPMHTVCINTDQSYFLRAWCAAEFLNGSHLCRSMVFPYTGSVAVDIKAPKAGSVFESTNFAVPSVFLALLDTTDDYRDILTFLGYAFTDEEHNCQAPTICWILWNAVLRDPARLCLDLSHQKLGNAEPYMFLGMGKIRKMRPWFKLLWMSLTKSNGTELLEYERDTWHNLRSTIVADVHEFNRTPQHVRRQFFEIILYTRCPSMFLRQDLLLIATVATVATLDNETLDLDLMAHVSIQFIMPQETITKTHQRQFYINLEDSPAW